MAIPPVQFNTATSYYLENQFLNHLFRNTSFTSPTKTYLGLYRTEPGDSDTGLEINRNTDNNGYLYGYARVELTGLFSAATGGSIVNSSNIIFPVATDYWEPFSYFGIRTGSCIGANTGNLLFYGAFEANNPYTIHPKQVFVITPANLKVNMKNIYSIHAANKLLDHTLRNVPYTSPGTNVYLSLYYKIPDRNNLNGVEISASSGYIRPKVGGSGSWQAGTTGWIRNASAIVVINPSGGVWGSMEGMGVCDAATSGSLLYAKKFSGGKITVVDGDNVMFDKYKLLIRGNYVLQEDL